ncbi:MAG: hypothetical protein NC131_17000, partial [Roseburia sp.]|nr:hypothetical protein [Roseburia sp.]
YYAVFCVFRDGPGYLNDVSCLPKVVDIVKPVVVCNNYFSNDALAYAKARDILLMGNKQIELTFQCDCIVFVGRQG